MSTYDPPTFVDWCLGNTMPAASVTMSIPERRARARIDNASVYDTLFKGVPSQYAMVRRVLSAYRAASDHDRDTGARWYWSMHSLLVRIANEDPRFANGQHHRVIGAFAELSPGCPLVNNMISLLGVLDGETAGLPSYPDSVKRARAVLDGESIPALDARSNNLDRSRKVKSFYANLTGNQTRVTVDRHAQRIAGVSDHIEQVNGGAYIAVEMAYQRAAAIENIAPPDMQAITWVAVRDVDGGRELDQLAKEA